MPIYEYLAPSETLRHEPLVYQCAKFIIAHQGKCIPTEVLVQKFIGSFTKGRETKVRQAVETYVNDLIFDKVIISTHDGYLHPTREQRPLVEDYFRTTSKTARSIFYRRSNQIKRLRLDGQYKELLGRYDKPIYEAITLALEEESALDEPKNGLAVEIYTLKDLEQEEQPIIIGKVGEQVSLKL